MSRHARVVIVVLALVALGGCRGPFFVFPGGALEGETAPAPGDWSFADHYGMVELETRPEEPYSVNIAYTVLGDTLYINAGDTRTRWVQNMETNPNVRLRLDGTIYALRAERVSDTDEIARFGRAWTDQSMFRRDPTELDEVWLYRLVPR